MKQLLLHVGTHKTGTTAIQHALFAERDALLRQGVLYDTGFDQVKGTRYAQHGVSHALARFNDEDQAGLAAYRARLLNAPCDRIVISAEPFYRHFDRRGFETAGAPEDYEERRRVYLDRVAEYFDCFDTRVSLYFRRPDSFASSLFKENVTSNSMKQDFPDFLQGRARVFQYADRLNDFETRFPKTDVFSFEALTKRGLIAGFFADHGLTLSDSFQSDPVRQGVSDRAALWLLRAKQETDLDAQAISRRWAFGLSPEGDEVFKSGAKEMFWDSAAARAAFVRESLKGFSHADFWADDLGNARPIEWSDDAQASAEAAFLHWQKQHIVALRVREAIGAKPFTPYDQLPKARRNILSAYYTVASLLRAHR
ncbi:hypothetical protein [Actibacterium lipolyticum]|uniref:Sulfotransferase family protein n=1 Tax=Actibacterium lipolyticum TaxID=1524263 RepID=A0A238KI39_9RHOB|nr:hypothetical protein [Actibacterium lipolyticum]SMX42529.1 hypothetical protein COL8621_01999 [Actibacterium lipolyticum]